MKFRLLDLYCCEGGAAMGYGRAGFDVVGVDHKPRPRYPFPCIQADALDYVRQHGHEFDAIHASPPCQAYSRNRHVWKTHSHPELIEPTRDALRATGRPYVIENVEGAPLIADMTIWLKGTMFGLRVFRKRGFESNVLLLQPKPIANRHFGRAAKQGRPAADGEYVTVTGHFNQADGYAKRAMGIDWMTRYGMSQALPPAYTEFIGAQLIAYLNLGVTETI